MSFLWAITQINCGSQLYYPLLNKFGEVSVVHLSSFMCCAFVCFALSWFCSQCCQCLWIVHSWLSLWFSLPFVLCLMCPMLPVSLNCPFLIVLSVFSNVYEHWINHDCFFFCILFLFYLIRSVNESFSALKKQFVFLRETGSINLPVIIVDCVISINTMILSKLWNSSLLLFNVWRLI
jgi:hypothetical protein